MYDIMDVIYNIFTKYFSYIFMNSLQNKIKYNLSFTSIMDDGKIVMNFLLLFVLLDVL